MRDHSPGGGCGFTVEASIVANMITLMLRIAGVSDTSNIPQHDIGNIQTYIRLDYLFPGVDLEQPRIFLKCGPKAELCVKP